MATTTVTLNDTMIGMIVSPGPDQFVTRLEKTRTQWPPVQNESWFVPPYPHGVWTAGRFVLRQGDGRRIYSFNSQTQAGVLIRSSIRFVGDLTLECLALGEEWRIDFSDTPISAQSQWAA
jgi:hypothetical protein